jgi:negative regulator of flagellin synthesis FlgM
MSKIHSTMPPVVAAVTNTPKRGGTPATDAVKSGADVGATQSTLVASGTLGTRAPAATNAPVDTAKVEKLRAAVLDGSYKIDSQKIADRLVDLEKTLP